MNVLLLSKNFRDGEDVSEYTKNLAEFLVSQGHDATIISFDDGSEISIFRSANCHGCDCYSSYPLYWWLH